MYVTAVMPCLNEENSIGICIDKAFRCFAELGIRGEVVVADNGSTDRSVEIAESLGARVVHESRRGYGAALMCGIEAAKGRIVIMADADDSYDWLAMGDFICQIENGFDLVMGNRFKGGIAPGAMPPLHRYLGNPVLSTVTRLLYDIPIGDFHCGMRAFTNDAYKRMKLRTDGMEFATEMIVYAAQAGLRIGEIPTTLSPDKRGRPPHLRSFRDGWRHLRFIVTYAPDYLYMAPGSLFWLLGLLGLIGLVNGPAQLFGRVLGIHFLVLASMLFLLGNSILTFGVLAKAYHNAHHPLPPSLFSRFLRRFTLEKGVLTGLALFLIGASTDAYILFQWIERHQGAMADTVHLAIVAGTATILGLHLVFSSFLLNMMKAGSPAHAHGRA
ncbi:glycosyltransferase family 2 protein [Azospira restricta]|uniref:Glycosyltransferase family 2 protein n=1 Tax=Azospira restricta TaxID=404405 RepID=A0A974SSR9_9RHOO|nr:glycosyltransferase family 2 protein [Azospira restricta]